MSKMCDLYTENELFSFWLGGKGSMESSGIYNEAVGSYTSFKKDDSAEPIQALVLMRETVAEQKECVESLNRISSKQEKIMDTCNKTIEAVNEVMANIVELSCTFEKTVSSLTRVTKRIESLLKKENQ